ncbi:MAG: hypothetical protein JSW43_05035 [Gemmatimonadota bacterium]|nr:MAG: hypothetical protein JSW43_05035 [Gemmatimonadota bacterium]
MEEQAYIGELAAGILYFIAGVRLLRLASRTGETPERLLGTMFAFTGISFLAYQLSVVVENEALWTPLNFIGRLLYLPAPFILTIFTRQVFRRDSPWASWLVYGCAALLVAGVTGSVLVGDWEGFSVSNRWFWLEWLGYTLPYSWAGTESFIQRGQARRRMGLGLGDPFVCNRFLLWGLFGAAQLCTSLGVLGQYAAYEQASVFAVGWDILLGALEILSVGLIYLVFFPPAFYRDWIATVNRVVSAGES